MSGSFSKQKSTQSSQQSSLGFSGSSSFGQSAQSVFSPEVYAKLFGDSTDAAAGVDSGAISDTAKTLFSSGLGFLDRLGGGAGADELAARAAGGDTSGRDAQLDTLKTQLGDFFKEQLVPGITDRGVSTGTFGGARDAVELSSAAKAVAGQFSTGASSIISQDQAQRDAAAGKLADVTNTGAGVGLNALQALFGISQSGETAGLEPYQILAQILGGPTVLGESTQGSSSYGFDSSQGTSTGASSGFGIGGGIGFSKASAHP